MEWFWNIIVPLNSQNGKFYSADLYEQQNS